MPFPLFLPITKIIMICLIFLSVLPTPIASVYQLSLLYSSVLSPSCHSHTYIPFYELILLFFFLRHSQSASNIALHFFSPPIIHLFPTSPISSLLFFQSFRFFFFILQLHQIHPQSFLSSSPLSINSFIFLLFMFLFQILLSSLHQSPSILISFFLSFFRSQTSPSLYYKLYFFFLQVFSQ